MNSRITPYKIIFILPYLNFFIRLFYGIRSKVSNIVKVVQDNHDINVQFHITL